MLKQFAKLLTPRQASTGAHYTRPLFDPLHICVSSVMALASTARELDWHRPQLVDENVLRIDRGRHPLVEQCTRHFVANDLYSADERRIKILAGPNASGKSVYLKQVSSH